MEPVRVLLVDDEPLVRAGLKAILGGAPEIDVVGEAGDGREALRRVAELAPHVVLMDIRMPVLDGVAATGQIRAGKAEGAGPHVVVLTTFDGDDSVTQALRAGARGYLLKTTTPDRLIAGILDAARGEPVLSPSVTAPSSCATPTSTREPSGIVENVSIDVQIWSDIACPWCYIGKRRFEKALEEFPQREQVTVTWRSYQLDPTLPERDERSEVDYLVERKGMPRAQVEQMMGHVKAAAEGEGLTYDFDGLVVANSRKAHRVLQLAKNEDRADGGNRTDALKEALLAAHFEHAEDISDVAVLTRIAAQAGLDQSDARAAVDSGELDRAVDADIALGHQIGVQGVPFFVFANKYGVSGAQPPEVFAQVLQTVASEQVPGLITLDGEAGDACGPDGC